MLKKRILVTGGSGFIGTNLIKILKKSKKFTITATFFNSKNFYKFKGVNYKRVNLENSYNCKKICKNIDVVIMCAAKSSGAAEIEKTPLVHLTPNIRMNMNMLEASYLRSVKKFIFISSNTVYPECSKPVKEEDAKFNFFYKYFVVAWMKRFSEIVCEIYSKKIKTKMETLIIRPGNLYGPYDKFDPKKSKVIPALISKIYKRHNPLIVWGNGKDIKDFLFIDDFCNILLKIINKKTQNSIYNVASGKSITINKIIKIIFKLENLKKIKIFYDKNKPKMIPIRLINIKRIKKEFNFKPTTTIEKGLKKTIDWYKKNS